MDKREDFPQKWMMAVSMREVGLPEFIVSGGPFSQEQHMGIHITDRRGFTIAVSCEADFANTLNSLMALLYLLDNIDAMYILGDARDDGRIDCTDEQWQALRKHWRVLTKAFIDAHL